MLERMLKTTKTRRRLLNRRFAPDLSRDGRRRRRWVATWLLSAPVEAREARDGADDVFAPECLRPHPPGQQRDARHAAGRDGTGHLHLDAHADRRGARGRSRARSASSPRRRTTSCMPIRSLGFQVTGGSTSVRGFWEPLRRAGATARVMLIAAAASAWNVDPASCRAEKGAVMHPPTGRKLTTASSSTRRRSCRCRTTSRSRTPRISR